ncbi:MAG: DUF1905 domain-containing protein [Dehalococcoidia bacterium]|nr:DUF1905 domain-containing protein [Dehalococcoidia bacterium]
MADLEQRFITTLRTASNGGFRIDLPFDPSQVWGRKDRHHINGSVNGIKVRGPLQSEAGAYFLVLGSAWRRDASLNPSAGVDVVLAPEGPQQDALADDVAHALAAEPAAAAFFDSLATFYRKAYLRWVDATKRSPEERAARIRQLIELLKAGKKER